MALLTFSWYLFPFCRSQSVYRGRHGPHLSKQTTPPPKAHLHSANCTPPNAMTSTSNQLPDARLVMTGHTPDGTSVFTFDDIRKPFMPFGPQKTHFTNLHSSPTVPASNTAPYPDLPEVIPRCPPEGRLVLHHRYPTRG
ncbi:Cupin-2 domain-containing protein [Mycena venus]|uniref:Cupin-2 domain-containing protein n=1 Tax=Mycena venus TaxID=2733690 RepID=A0A8H6XD26_9AGAR|nr:Cupin-2 domain-containing protein [Mycena venus]